MPSHKQAVLSSYRRLLKLIQRLPPTQKQASLQEASKTVKARKVCEDAETRLGYLKELAAKIGYLRVITPRLPGDVAEEAGRYVLRDGQLIAGEGESIGDRVASSAITMSEAVSKNKQHFKRFYGADKPKDVFF